MTYILKGYDKQGRILAYTITLLDNDETIYCNDYTLTPSQLNSLKACDQRIRNINERNANQFFNSL